MKFQSIKPFKKHFDEKPFRNIYLIACDSRYERCRMMEFISEKAASEHKLSINKFSSEEVSIDKIFLTFDSPSLFGGGILVVLDAIEMLNKHIGFYEIDNKQRANQVTLNNFDNRTLNAIYQALNPNKIE